MVGLVAVAIRQGINLFDRVVMGWLGGLSAFIILMVVPQSMLNSRRT